ncbi:MAG: GNAT family N-acetyltransferase [Acidimicrobiia bacterium]|nr:GNAT family N-acetyltransferase [Acidimicrobiia bacterium]
MATGHADGDEHVSARLPEHIAGTRLVIRRWRVEDAEPLSRLIEASLTHLRPWMAWAAEEPMPIEQRRRLIEHWDRYWETGDGVVYGIFERAAPVGGCGLHRRIGPGGLDLGYWIGADHTGRGLATETARQLTTAAFETDDIDHVEINHERSNTASAAVARRLGYAGIRREPDDSTDVMGWRVDRTDWLAR